MKKSEIARRACTEVCARMGEPACHQIVDDEFSPCDACDAVIDEMLAAMDRYELAKGRDHLTVSGTFQSDKYPTVPAGKVPLSVKDPLAQPLLWQYALMHEVVNKHGDTEFPRDLKEALINAGYEPPEG